VSDTGRDQKEAGKVGAVIHCHLSTTFGDDRTKFVRLSMKVLLVSDESLHMVVVGG